VIVSISGCWPGARRNAEAWPAATLVRSSRASAKSHCASTKLQHSSASHILSSSQHRPICVDCRRALRLAGRRPFTHFFQLQVFCSSARRLCLRATPIFALCSDHCKKNNGNNERNAFVNPFWVERGLNPYIKPYRQYRSAFFTSEITSSGSEHPLATVLEHLTPEARQSPTSTIAQAQEVETNNTTSVSLDSPPPTQPHQVAPSPIPSDTPPRDFTASFETDATESASTSLAEGASPTTNTYNFHEHTLHILTIRTDFP